jgi:hypothetical protein
MKTETIAVNGESEEKQQSSERQKKAAKESVRKAVGETPVLADQLAAPSYKVTYVAIDAINVNFTDRRAAIPKNGRDPGHGDPRGWSSRSPYS